MYTEAFIVNSIVLLTNGISFSIQAVLLIVIGAWADYGLWRLGSSSRWYILLTLTSRPNITIFFTLLGLGVSFAWLGVEQPSLWRFGVALYILGCEPFPPQGLKLPEIFALLVITFQARANFHLWLCHCGLIYLILWIISVPWPFGQQPFRA